MKLTLNLIKKGISIISTGAILLTFLISILSTNAKSPNFIEYTDLSKFFLNIYTLFLLVLIFGHSIYPGIICSIFSKRFAIILSEKGKIILLSCILIMYFGTGSMPQKLFGFISFIGTFSLFLSYFFLNHKVDKQSKFVEEKKIGNFVITSPNVIVTNESFNNTNNNPI